MALYGPTCADFCFLQPAFKCSPQTPRYTGHSCRVLNITSFLHLPFPVYSSRIYMAHSLTSFKLLLKCHLFKEAFLGTLCKLTIAFMEKSIRIEELAAHKTVWEMSKYAVWRWVVFWVNKTLLITETSSFITTQVFKLHKDKFWCSYFQSAPNKANLFITIFQNT